MMRKGTRENGISPNANQKKMAAAFLVLHHPGRPFVKSSPSSSAWGSFLGFLHPGCVHADTVTINLVMIESMTRYTRKAKDISRDEEAERHTSAGQNKTNADFLQRPSESNKFVVFLVEYGDKQHEC